MLHTRKSELIFLVFLYLKLEDKIDLDKIPHTEDYFDFITQGTSSEEKMTLCKFHKIYGEKFNQLHGCFNGIEVLPNRDGLNTKKALERKKDYFLIIFFIVP